MRAWQFGIVGLALLFGAISHWVIFEYDLFWQVRFGRELLAGAPVQSIDRWSHTAFGTPYRNIQWLSTIFMALVAKLAPGYIAFGYLRSLFIAGWIYLLGRLSRAGRWPLFVAILLVPWIYLASWFRLQMRPDLFAACIFAALLLLLLSNASDARKRLGGLALLLLSANVHTGTVVFGILLYSSYALTANSSWRNRLVYAGLGFLCWFATPNGITILQIVRDNALTYDWSRTHNPDLQPFSTSLLELSQGGWALRLWVAYCGLALISLFQPKARLPALYQNRLFVLGVAGLLTLESLHHIRAIHYQMVFLLPAVATFIGSLTSRIQLAAPLAAACFLWGGLLPEQIHTSAHPIGDGVSNLDLPVESAAFIAAVRPTGKLHNAYPFGGYLIDVLPDYPVSIDGRELPFAAFRDEMSSAIGTGRYAEFLREHHIDIVLETLPGPLRDLQQGMIDGHEPLYPRQEWATVFFDNISIVYLRRTDANSRIIAQHEYQAIHRGISPNQIQRGAEAFYDREYERCLNEVADSIYCRMGKATILARQGQGDSALALLNEARRIDPKSLEVLVSLLQAAQGRNDQAAIEELVQTLDRVGHRMAP